jgi:hypothetical protein
MCVSCEVRTSSTYKKVELSPLTGRGELQSCEMLRISHCIDNQLTLAVRLSTSRTVRALFHRNIFISASGTHLC